VLLSAQGELVEIKRYENVVVAGVY